MAIDGILGTVSHDDDRARGHGHDPVIVSAKIATNQGVLPVGLIVSKNGSGELVPYAAVEDEAFGTGTVNYATGVTKVSFNAAPANGAASFPRVRGDGP